MRLPLAAACIFTTALASLVPSTSSACMPPPPVDTRTIADGIHEVELRASGRVARDGGVLLGAHVVNVDDAALLAGLRVYVKNGDVAVPGTLRVVSRNAGPRPGESTVVLHFDVEGALPVTSTLHVEATYERAPAEESADVTRPSSWTLEVVDVSLTDVAIPSFSLAEGESVRNAAPDAPTYTCTLKEPHETELDPCGDGAGRATVTTRTFHAKEVLQSTVRVLVEGDYDYGASSYVTYSTRLTWEGGGEAGSYVGNTAFMVPEGVREVCFEITASSSLVAGFPKVKRSCVTLSALTPLTAEDEERTFLQEAESCAVVNDEQGRVVTNAGTPEAVSSGDGGCHAHGAGGGRGIAGAGVLLGVSLLTLRRRRSA